MLYYVVLIQLPDFTSRSLVLVLDKTQNLMDQVVMKLGNDVVILDIRVMGDAWPTVQEGGV